MNFNENINDNNQPTNQPKMSSIMRTMSMCPTGADSLNLSEEFFDESMRSQNMGIMRSNSVPMGDREWPSREFMEAFDEVPSDALEEQVVPTSEAEPSDALEEQVVPSEAVPSEAVPSEAVPSAKEKKKILAPPMHYDLHKADAAFVYGHIQAVIKNDAAAIKYLETVVKPALFAQKTPIVFGYIPAPPNADITKMIIGRDGYFFKMTTACCNVYFIWHELETNTFLFWGPTVFKTVKAMNSIRWRIFKHFEQFNSKQDDDDDCADMPELISCGNTPDYEHPEQN